MSAFPTSVPAMPVQALVADAYDSDSSDDMELVCSANPQTNNAKSDSLDGLFEEEQDSGERAESSNFLDDALFSGLHSEENAKFDSLDGLFEEEQDSGERAESPNFLSDALFFGLQPEEPCEPESPNFLDEELAEAEDEDCGPDLGEDRYSISLQSSESPVSIAQDEPPVRSSTEKKGKGKAPEPVEVMSKAKEASKKAKTVQAPAQLLGQKRKASETSEEVDSPQAPPRRKTKKAKKAPPSKEIIIRTPRAVTLSEIVSLESIIGSHRHGTQILEGQPGVRTLVNQYGFVGGECTNCCALTEPLKQHGHEHLKSKEAIRKTWAKTGHVRLPILEALFDPEIRKRTEHIPVNPNPIFGVSPVGPVLLPGWDHQGAGTLNDPIDFEASTVKKTYSWLSKSEIGAKHPSPEKRKPKVVVSPPAVQPPSFYTPIPGPVVALPMLDSDGLISLDDEVTARVSSSRRVEERRLPASHNLRHSVISRQSSVPNVQRPPPIVRSQSDGSSMTRAPFTWDQTQVLPQHSTMTRRVEQRPTPSYHRARSSYGTSGSPGPQVSSSSNHSFSSRSQQLQRGGYQGTSQQTVQLQQPTYVAHRVQSGSGGHDRQSMAQRQHPSLQHNTSFNEGARGKIPGHHPQGCAIDGAAEQRAQGAVHGEARPNSYAQSPDSGYESWSPASAGGCGGY